MSPVYGHLGDSTGISWLLLHVNLRGSMSISPQGHPPLFCLVCIALYLWRWVFREKKVVRVFVLIKRDRYRDPLDGDKADLGYRWLHTCLESLSSSDQWHPQSPPPDGTALWCLAPAEKIKTHETEWKKKDYG